jgi:hypothetical protein
MTRRLFAVLFAVAAAACGSSAPTAPTPPAPVAVVVDTGVSQVTNCLPLVNVCSFQAEIRNQGPDCASNIRGTVRFADKNNTIIASENWTTGGGTLRRDERFVYTVPNLALSMLNTAATYDSHPSWDVVRCPS